MAGKFSLAELIAEGKVSNLGTKGREQIEYIDIGLIDSDPNNFYELSGVDELAGNIELMGLQQPIRVRANAEDPARVVVVSGHRRRAAIQKLVDEGREDLREIPCIREQVEGSPAMQELRLIYANSDTRRMTSAEISKQVERVEVLLYQLKEEGYEFPGRMRDHVAEACKVSKSKLARLKVIREGLDKCWVKYWEKGELAESSAYTLARMSADHQKMLREWVREVDRSIQYLTERELNVMGDRLARISKLKCSTDGAVCGNLHGKMEKALTLNTWQTVYCDKCCSGCPDLTKCKYACPLLGDKVKQLKAEASAQRKQEKLELEEKDRPVVEKIKALWNRFGMARNAADKTVEECYKAMGRYYIASDEQKYWKMECLEANYNPNTTLPFGYSSNLSEVEKYTKLADLFGCSLDYLLCRTDDPKGLSVPAASAEPPADGWVPLKWLPGMERPQKDGQKAVAKFALPNRKDPLERIVVWDEFTRVWQFPHGAGAIECECVGWFPLPEEDDQNA